MEKKAPERKVRLREGDVFYVYDKRINKCIREDCEGTVKYGLTLKVIMPNGDALNTYECNQCHMKYTAYPNYVRLRDTKELTIYNSEEVGARDRKRATDAAKQAAREKRKAHARRHVRDRAPQPQESIKTAEKKRDSYGVAKESKNQNRNQSKLHYRRGKMRGNSKEL